MGWRGEIDQLQVQNKHPSHKHLRKTEPLLVEERFFIEYFLTAKIMAVRCISIRFFRILTIHKENKRKYHCYIGKLFLKDVKSLFLNVQRIWHQTASSKKLQRTKALRKTEFSELFIFISFGIVRLPKFRNFSEISGLFELAKILRK